MTRAFTDINTSSLLSTKIQIYIIVTRTFLRLTASMHCDVSYLVPLYNHQTETEYSNLLNQFVDYIMEGAKCPYTSGESLHKKSVSTYLASWASSFSLIS